MYLSRVIDTVDRELEIVKKMTTSIGSEIDDFVKKIISCKGKLIFLGVGKSGHIARKAASTFSSLSIQSLYLHATEASHGDLGSIGTNDLIIILSKSGETGEIIKLIPSLKVLMNDIILITSNPTSTLAKFATLVVNTDIKEEVCVLNMAPTSSASGMLILLDAIAVVASSELGVTVDNFGLYHPSGTLGKRALIRVDDIAIQPQDIPLLDIKDSAHKLLLELTSNPVGCACVVDSDQKLLGIVTDGDLRRALEKFGSFDKLLVEDIYTSEPKTIDKNILAIEALNMLKRNERTLTVLPRVTEDNRLLGLITLIKLVEEKIL